MPAISAFNPDTFYVGLAQPHIVATYSGIASDTVVTWAGTSCTVNSRDVPGHTINFTPPAAQAAGVYLVELRDGSNNVIASGNYIVQTSLIRFDTGDAGGLTVQKRLPRFMSRNPLPDTALTIASGTGYLTIDDVTATYTTSSSSKVFGLRSIVSFIGFTVNKPTPHVRATITDVALWLDYQGLSVTINSVYANAPAYMLLPCGFDLSTTRTVNITTDPAYIFMRVFNTALSDFQYSRSQMRLMRDPRSAVGNWLDRFGLLYGLPRGSDFASTDYETDAYYSPRLVDDIMLPHTTYPSINTLLSAWARNTVSVSYTSPAFVLITAPTPSDGDVEGCRLRIERAAQLYLALGIRYSIQIGSLSIDEEIANFQSSEYDDNGGVLPDINISDSEDMGVWTITEDDKTQVSSPPSSL